MTTRGETPAPESGQCYLGICPLHLSIGQALRPCPFSPTKGQIRGPQVKSATARWNPQPPKHPDANHSNPALSTQHPAPNRETHGLRVVDARIKLRCLHPQNQQRHATRTYVR